MINLLFSLQMAFENAVRQKLNQMSVFLLIFFSSAISFCMDFSKVG